MKPAVLAGKLVDGRRVLVIGQREFVERVPAVEAIVVMATARPDDAWIVRVLTLTVLLYALLGN